MGKVSIGLRGWRFDEEEVFTDEGEFRPMDEIPADPRKRLMRLQTLVESPCDACWLVHGDENLQECNVAEVVYGEPLAEVLLCADHEPDFLHWFGEADGSRFKGEERLQDEFHEWFADGGRAPEGYGGVEHVETDPGEVPEPPEPDPEELNVELPEEEQKRIDLRDVDLDGEGEDGEGENGEDEDGESEDSEESTGEGSEGDGDDERLAPDADLDDDLDLDRDYPSS